MFFDVLRHLYIKNWIHECTRALENNGATGVLKFVFEFDAGIQDGQKSRTIHSCLTVDIDHLAGGILQKSVHMNRVDGKPVRYVYQWRVYCVNDCIFLSKMIWNKAGNRSLVCTIQDVRYVVFLDEIGRQEYSRTKHDAGVESCRGIAQEAF